MIAHAAPPGRAGFMTELFDTTYEPPAWFRGGTPTQEKNVRAGKHPLGLALLAPPGRTCGDCKHCHPRPLYKKCKKYGTTNGPGSDIRLKWAACVEFEKKGF